MTPQDDGVGQYESPDPQVRLAVVQRLLSIASPSPAELAVIEKAFRDPSEEVRWKAYRAFDSTLLSVEVASPLFLRLLTDPTAEMGMRWDAALMLGRREGETGITLLLTVVAHPEHTVRLEAINQLGDAVLRSSQASSILTALLQALADPWSDIRDAARDGLVRAGHMAIPALEQLLTSPNPLLCAQAGLALLRIDGRHATSIAVVQRNLQHPEEKVRLLAVKAIDQGLADQEKKCALLLRAVDDPSSDVASHAAFALGDLLPPRDEVLKRFNALLLETEEWQLRENICTALCCYGRHAARALPGILATLDAFVEDFDYLGGDGLCAWPALLKLFLTLRTRARRCLPSLKRLLKKAKEVKRKDFVNDVRAAIQKVRPRKE